MKVFLELSQEDVMRKIPYALICETTYGSRWDTMKRKRMEKDWFTLDEIRELSKLKKQSYTWFTGSGIPLDGVRMSVNTFQLWQKFGLFCKQL